MVEKSITKSQSRKNKKFLTPQPNSSRHLLRNRTLIVELKLPVASETYANDTTLSLSTTSLRSHFRFPEALKNLRI